MNRRYDLATDAADYPPWEGPPHRSLLICTEQRSGSTLLGEALYFAGGLGCALEYFSSGFRPSFALDWNAPDIDRYLAALYRRRTDPSGVISVKLFWGDIEDLAQDIAPDILDNQPMNDPARVGDDVYRRLFALLQPILPSPIHVALTRRDRIAQALSNVTAASTRKWRKLERQPATPATDSTYDFDATVQWLGHIDHANAHWRRYFAAMRLCRCAWNMRIWPIAMTKRSAPCSMRWAGVMPPCRRRGCKNRQAPNLRRCANDLLPIFGHESWAARDNIGHCLAAIS